MSRDFYDYIRRDAEDVMPGPATVEESSQYRLVGKLLKEFQGGADDV